MAQMSQVREHYGPRTAILRWVLLLLIVVGFARVTWELGAKDLWWDESLSLQRAESGWGPLLQGQLIMYDGETELVTIDQHPFGYFVLLGVLIRLAGQEEYVLRFVSVMAATLLIPTIWAMASHLAKRDVWPRSSAYFAAGFAAVHPFFLWYGQEARPYALWAMLAVMSTYLLLRVTDGPTSGKGWWIGYGLSLALFLSSHYFAVFLLPVHMVLLLAYLWTRDKLWAITATGVLVVAGVIVAAYAFWIIVVRQGGGGNFPEISWSMLVPDLVNAHTLGLSVDLADVWWFDLLFSLVAISGAVWSCRSSKTIAAQGWVPVAMVLVPVVVLMLVDTVRPAYMNARHLSLIGGGYILLVGGGLGLLWQYQRWAALSLAALLLVGTGVSTRNYFTLEEYAKDDYSSLGAYLDGRVAAGDLVLTKSPFSWRIFSYYLPVDGDGPTVRLPGNVAHFGVPLLAGDWNSRGERMAEWSHMYRRIWFVVSGTHPYQDLEGRTEQWLDEHLFRVQEVTFFSHSSLQAHLYLPEVPVYESIPPTVTERPDVEFGDLIRLAGYEVGETIEPGLALPVTLYWEILEPTQTRYKYVLKLVRIEPDGGETVLSVTEREPYDGAIPTIYWQPDQYIVEFSELPIDKVLWEGQTSIEGHVPAYQLQLQLYAADTLDKLPVSSPPSGMQGGTVGEDGVTVSLPYLPQTVPH